LKAQTSPYTGTTVQAGEEFYLYNVESGMWLQENARFTADWNTRGELGEVGFDVELIANGSGWTINPKFGHNGSMNGSNWYLDTNDPVTAWTFEPAEVEGVSNAYRIKYGDLYLHATPSPEFKLIVNDVAARHTWQIVTREERINYAKTATVANPKDLSFLIRANEFTQEDTRKSTYWSLTDNDNGGISWNSGRFAGDNRQNSVFEAWDMTKMKLSQTISGLPAGYYEVEARASESPTGNGDVSLDLLNQYNAGTLAQYGVLFANNDTQTLPSIYSEQYSEKPTGHYAARNLGSIWMIDGVNQFSYAVANKASAYKVTLQTQLTEDGDITLGVQVKDAPNQTVWVMADKFRLRYLGTTLEVDLSEYTSVLETTIEEAEAFNTELTSSVLAQALSEAIAAGKTTLTTATTADEVTDAINAIETALENAKSVNVKTLRATIALADAESLTGTELNTQFATNNVLDEAKAALQNATTATQVANALSSLQRARRVFHAERHAIDFTGSEPAEGNFYLYNVGQKQFLCGGSDWGAHAALGWPGIEVTLVAGEGGYAINTHLNNGGDLQWLGNSGYCDSGESGAIWVFQDKSADGVKKYNLMRPEDPTNRCMGFNPNFQWTRMDYDNLGTSMTDFDDPNNQWILVTKAERDAMLGEASPTNPVDASYMIKMPNFSQREYVFSGSDNWAKPSEGGAWNTTNWSIFGRGGNQCDFVCESWNSEANNLNQTIENLPSGLYEVQVQGYFRDGDREQQVALADAPTQLATFFANTSEALLPNILTEKDKAPGLGWVSEIGEFPDGVTQAADFFELGLYKTTITNVVVGSDGKLELGVKKESKNYDRDWVVVDNFRLRYLGPIEIENMSVVGDFSENDWKPTQGIAMTQDAENPAIWTAELNNFEIKSDKLNYEYKAVANGNWTDYVLPAGDNQNYNFDFDGAGAGIYNLTFTANTTAKTIELTKVEKVFTAYFDNSSTNWEKVCAWAWIDDGENYTGGTWPGMELTETDADGNYVFSVTRSVPNFGPAKIIFNNGNTEAMVQTANLEFVNGSIYNFNGIQVTLDEEATEQIAAYSKADVTLTRAFNQGWNAVVLPFDTEAFDNAQIAELESETEDADGNVTLNFKKAESIKANVPYLVYFPAAVDAGKVFEGVTVAPAEAKVEGTRFDFVGTHVKATVVTEGDYVISEGKLAKASTDIELKGGRTFFQAKNTAGVRSVNLNFSDDLTTGIRTLDNLTISPIDNSVYDLQGRRLSNGQMQKGLYIVNGKKVVK